MSSAKRRKISTDEPAGISKSKKKSAPVQANAGSDTDAKDEPKAKKQLKARSKEEEKDDSSSAEEESAKDEVEQGKEVKKSFKDLGIIDELCEACAKMGFKNPTAIQAEAIPLALQGRDLIGLAETGSGKTAAFALPILQALMEKPQPFFGLVLAPTRELAAQISNQFEALGSLISVRCAVLVGGLDIVSQAIALGKKPHIVVATPGRLLDHLENTKGFSLRNLKYLVMDEADRMLDSDFGKLMDTILKHVPRERNTCLFSATMSTKVESLQRAALRNPVKVSVSSTYQTVSTLIQKMLFVPAKHKDIYLIYLLADPQFAGKSIIIFTRTINEAQRVSLLCRNLGFSAIPIHGQLSQQNRLGALNKFREKRNGTNILVATDVAARGLDIPNVDLVINFDLPDDSKTYIHRVGRTARAGQSGFALTIATQYDVELLTRIEQALGKKLDDDFAAPKDEVMVFAPRVSDAQREAVKKMKELHEDRGNKGALLKGRRPKNGVGGKRDRSEMDKDEG